MSKFSFSYLVLGWFIPQAQNLRLERSFMPKLATEEAQEHSKSLENENSSQLDYMRRREFLENEKQFQENYEGEVDLIGEGSYPFGSYSKGDHGVKVKPKKPGPFGKATPNFKCEYFSETLYVTKTEITFDKKCFNVFNVKCEESYDEGKVY